MNVKQLLERLRDAGKREGFEFTPFGVIEEHRLYAMHRPTQQKNAPHIYLSAGVHGDEPAGPIAILDLLRNRRLSRNIAWTIIPLVNPTGLELKTRENDAGIDLNRDYGSQPKSKEVRNHLIWLGEQEFTVAVCLHEDYETDGAYLFELKPDDSHSCARELLDTMAPFVGIESRAEIDDMPNDNGLMKPPRDELDKDRDDLPEALKLYFGHTPWCYTIETPSQSLITDRVSAQVSVVDALSQIALEDRFPQH